MTIGKCEGVSVPWPGCCYGRQQDAEALGHGCLSLWRTEGN